MSKEAGYAGWWQSDSRGLISRNSISLGKNRLKSMNSGEYIYIFKPNPL